MMPLENVSVVVCGNATRVFSRLKEQREQVESEHQEELEHFQQVTKDLRVKVDDLQRELDEKQVSQYSKLL